MTTTDTYKTFESKKFLNGLGIIFLAAVLTAVGNMIQTNVKQGLEPLSFWQSFEGCMVLFGVATIGYFIISRALVRYYWGNYVFTNFPRK